MKEYLVNEQIKSATMIVVTSEGEKKGEFTKMAAINMARAEGLDLVLVSMGNPPVCKIADLGKIKYQQNKSEKKAHQQTTKEVYLHLTTGEHDINVKMKKVKEFLGRGDKVKFSIELKGREKEKGGHFRTDAKNKIATILGTDIVFDKTAIKEGEKEVFIILEPMKRNH